MMWRLILNFSRSLILRYVYHYLSGNLLHVLQYGDHLARLCQIVLLLMISNRVVLNFSITVVVETLISNIICWCIRKVWI